MQTNDHTHLQFQLNQMVDSMSVISYPHDVIQIVCKLYANQHILG